LANRIDDNMRRLDEVVKLQRGIEQRVRPECKKNDWYGEQIDATISQDSIKLEIANSLDS